MGDDVSVPVTIHLLLKVGQEAVGNGECFTLVDEALKAVGCKSAEDFGTVTEDADYVWGNRVALSQVRPGDVLQFRNHDVTVKRVTKTGWNEQSYHRDHHTAVVVAVNADGGVTVVEQNFGPAPKTVSKNTIHRLAVGTETRSGEGSSKDTITVKGSVKAYRPVPKEKGAMLFRQQGPARSGRRMLADYTPNEGGPKRVPGPIGLV
jgi:hypothetical protein